MESVLEVPTFRSSTNNFEFDRILNGILNNSKIYVQKCERPFVFEKLCDLVGRKSFKESKLFWKEIKKVFQISTGYQPFIYFQKNKFVLSKGMDREDLSFEVKNDELLYERSVVVVNPLELERLFDMYQRCQSEDDRKEVDEYAHYCISRELEKHQVQIVKNNLFRRKENNV